MSHKIKPSTARKLLKLAHQIRQIEPWKDLSDNDWFSIQNPSTGGIQIVAIMGMAKQVFSIQLHLPEEGIRFWNNVILHGAPDPNIARFHQRMLECEFCDDDDLPKEDIEFYEAYGIKDSQPHAIPVLRKMEPELYPWFLKEDDAQMLCHALLLTQTYHRNRRNYERSFFNPVDMNGFPEIPLYSLKKGASPEKESSWEVKRIPFPKAPKKTIPESYPDDLFLNKFHTKKKQPTHWEIGSNYISEPSKDNEEDAPYYPILTLCVDPNAEAPPEPEINHPHKDKALVLRQSFTLATEHYGYLPSELRVSTPLAFQAFKGITEAYGIKLTQVDDLPTLWGIMQPLLSAIEGNLPPQLLEMLNSEDFDFESLPEKMKEILQSLFENDHYGDEDEKELIYSPPQSTSRYILRIDIKGAKPPIWRRISIPTDATFFDLHHAIQNVFEWGNAHPHLFEIKNGSNRIIIQPEEEHADSFGLDQHLLLLDEFSTPISIADQLGIKKMEYTYDFGDNWEHTIKFEKIIETDIANPHPTIIKGSGASLPEDCGGIYGYYALMDEDKDFCEMSDAQELEDIRNKTFNIEDIIFE